MRFAAKIALLAVTTFLAAAFAKSAAADNIDVALKDAVNPPVGSTVKVAPMIKPKGHLNAGNETKVDDTKIFTDIFKLIPIEPCTTEPKDLDGKTGFLKLEKSSDVLNKGATRATFGFFIRVAETTKPIAEKAEVIKKEFFALFSYDKIDKPNVICATEFFLFGSFIRKGDKPDPNPPALILGLAVNNKGDLLPEVPIGLAKVSNYIKQGAKPDETVKPGVKAANEGCLRCHSRDENDVPQQTTPFPWVAIP